MKPLKECTEREEEGSGDRKPRTHRMNVGHMLFAEAHRYSFGGERRGGGRAVRMRHTTPSEAPAYGVLTGELLSRFED